MMMMIMMTTILILTKKLKANTLLETHGNDCIYTDHETTHIKVLIAT
jgi:hypothetical protein